MDASKVFDYVIVGAGSAGCVLANRLSEDPSCRVLLLEAGGPDTNDFIHIPAGMAALFRTKDDWDLGTAYEPELNSRRVYLPRGKVLGGSSSINAMIYIRGARSDWDGWAAQGCEGWSYDEVLPYFLRAEDHARGASDVHGAGGPLTVSEPVERGELSQRFLDACAAAGMPANDDFNGGTQDGVGWYQTTIRDGKRCSTAVAYLHPVMDRPNLVVETWVHAAKVLFDGTRAVGVAGLRLGEELVFHAEREVLVACGAYLSPQLLTLSGLGRPDELEQLQVPLVAESPGMGLGLVDHPTAGVTFTIDREISLKDALTDEALAAWMGGTGVLTTNPAPAGGFVRTKEGLGDPDVQLHFVPAIFEQEGLMPPPEHGFTLSACVLKPRSRGYVAVTSPDPTAKPAICHNYLADPEDLAAQVAGVQLALDVVAQGPLAELSPQPHLAPASRDHADVEAHVRQTLQTIYHPVGTCRMGSDPTAVVDAQLRVRGVEGLRVVDASVLPDTPRGNTNAPVIALAERAADLIRGAGAAQPAQVAAAAPAALAG
ncbi:GMC family oxidoreductase [Conexibacter sp. SYSU D00693]|uniref:GMC family oxidoreductase n=1 Tax=Conexibacter sp. SYSU D00693 TaxID=2812560 RepID=UPI00196A75FA|nr:GMC family oxidoreductase N-terminal domain-containing protein [Conexibacter sp. SYSU D00693]